MKRIQMPSPMLPPNIPAPVEAPLPPPPPQMNAPVGPPPPPVTAPTDFQGMFDLSRKVGAQQGADPAKAILWATLAQAAATNRLADLLEELVEFIHADGEFSELSVAIAEGLDMAAETARSKRQEEESGGQSSPEGNTVSANAAAPKKGKK